MPDPKTIRVVVLGGFHAMAVFMLLQGLWLAGGLPILFAWAFVAFVHKMESQGTVDLGFTLQRMESLLEQRVIALREQAEWAHQRQTQNDDAIRVRYFQQSMRQRIQFLTDTEGTWTWLDHHQD